MSQNETSIVIRCEIHMVAMALWSSTNLLLESGILTLSEVSMTVSTVNLYRTFHVASLLHYVHWYLLKSGI